MSDAPVAERLQRDRLSRVGLVMTASYLVIVVIYIIVMRKEVLKLNPHDAADVLAGVFAPLAFLWLVLGFFQQGHELKLSSDALVLQGEELRNSVEQQRQLVATQREQMEAERQALDYEKSERIRVAQPLLKLKLIGSMSYGDGRMRQDLRLTNYATRCTDLTFARNDAVVRTRDLLDSGASEDLNFGFEHGAPEPFNLTVAFTDNLGDRGSVIFFVPVTYQAGVRIYDSPRVVRDLDDLGDEPII